MRTENEILKDFEQLGYKKHHWILADNLYLEKENITIAINTEARMYRKSSIVNNSEVIEEEITKQEKELINQILELWGWII